MNALFLYSFVIGLTGFSEFSEARPCKYLMHVHNVPVVVPISEIETWKADDYINRNGKNYLFQDNSTDPLSASAEQFIFLVDEYPDSEKRLIQKLIDASQSRKKTNQGILQKFKKNSDWMIQLSSEDAKYYTQEYIGANIRTNGLETGAWRINLRSGNVITAIHTSLDLHAIDDKDFLAAIKGALVSNSVDIDDITDIGYFHTHPALGGGPLSHGDESVITKMQQNLERIVKRKVSAYIVAIVAAPDKVPFTFFSSYP